MKKLLMVAFVLAFWLVFVVQAFAMDVTLEWDANTEADLAGYKIYKGLSSGNYDNNVIDAKNVTTYTITGLTGGTRYYFAVTAYDMEGFESDFSNEVNTDGKPSQVKGLIIKTVVDVTVTVNPN